MDVILFDTETTGLLKPNAAPLSQQPYITEIFMLRVTQEGKQVVSSGQTVYSTLVKPPIPIPAEVIEITGITDDMVKDAPAFADIYPELARFCLGAERWVAHNLAFDKGMLLAELGRVSKRANFPWPLEDFCTVENSMHLSKKLRNDGTPKYMKLTELHELATGKPHDQGAHRAQADVLALMRCYRWLLEQGNGH